MESATGFGSVMKAPLLIIGLLVVMTLFYSAVRFSREKTLWRATQLCGAFCLLIVVLAHMAEGFNILPGMGWGQPNSPGHYLDLSAALAGAVLFPVGLVMALRRRPHLQR